jgi:hypothetical protein
MKPLKTNILIPAVALCIAGVLIVGKNFWIGVSLLVVALILTVFVYVRISKRISL